MAVRRSEWGRRSRRVLIWGLGLAMLAQVAGGLLLDYVWPLVRFPSAGKIVRALHSMPDAPRLVFLGSSRMIGAIEAGEVQRLLQSEQGRTQMYGVLNGAVPAGDLVAQELLLAKILRAGCRPEYLVMEVNPESLHACNPWMQVHVYRQLRWDDLFAYAGDIARSRELVRFLNARFFPLLLHRKAILESFAVGWSHAANSAWSTALSPGDKPDWDEMLRPPHVEFTPHMAAVIEASAKQMIVPWLRNYAVGGQSAAALDRILTRCGRENINVVLVGVPVSRPHRDCYTPEIDRLYRDHLARVCGRFGCQFVDCRDWLGDCYFVDTHHLCAAGGIYFSRLFTHRVLLPREVARVDADSAALYDHAND
jgi:hypothetical protein